MKDGTAKGVHMLYKLKANKTKKENLTKDFPSFNVLKSTPLNPI